MTDSVRLIQCLLERAVAAGEIAGAVAAWGRHGEPMQIATAGNAELLAVARQMTDETWFDLASLTKPLATTSLALLAIRSGTLGPRTTVGEVLPETDGSPVANLDLASLLTHTSGLPAWLPLYCLADGDPRQLPGRLGGIALEADPGTRVIYSCIGFIIAGMMLERVAGDSLDHLFHDRVLRPLGLERELGFNPDPDRFPVAAGALFAGAETRLVRGLGADATRIPPVARGAPDDGNARFLGGVAGNAGLFGTAHGVWRLTAEYSDPRGDVLHPADAALATSSFTAGLDQERGYGWQLAATAGCSAGPALATTAFGHTGFTGVSVWAEPGGARFVLLANRVHPAHRDVDLHPLRRRFHHLARGGMR